MPQKTPRDRYAVSAIVFHWGILALVVAGYACIVLRKNFPPESEIREGLRAWHYMIGLSIFGLSLIRLALRVFVWKIPEILPQPPKHIRRLSSSAHAALYAFLIAMPLAGWLILSVEGRTIPFWGWSLPPISPPDGNLAEPLEELHELVGTAGYFLIGLHAAAALFHQFVVKDNMLSRMLPPGR